MKNNQHIEKLCSEFIAGHGVHGENKPHITIFGSARLKPVSDHYKAAEELARKISDHGIPVMTGGGPGIMEAGNKGAKDGQGASLAASIELPHEQIDNDFIDKTSKHEYFMPRKWFLIDKARGFVVAPGGFGTADELFEVLCLVQTRKINKAPIVLLGKDFWKPAIDWFKSSMLPLGLIAESDLNLFLVTDDIDEAVSHLTGITHE